MWETVVLKRHLAYDPALDRESKVQEMRIYYENRQRDAALEGGKGDDKLRSDEDDEGEEISSTASSYFEKTPRLVAKNPQ
jgi:hypothetical protein